MTGPHSEREQWFRSLFADAYEDVLRFAQRRVHPSRAEDVVAEVFVVAWRRIDDAPKRPQHLRPWLFGIARHCLMNAQRGQGRQEALVVRLAETALPEGVSGSFDPDLVATQIDLAAAWRGLSANQQEVLALTVFENLTSRQAGRVLGITSAAYRLRLMRSRNALRRQLDPARPEPSSPTALEETAS